MTKYYDLILKDYTIIRNTKCVDDTLIDWHIEVDKIIYLCEFDSFKSDQDLLKECKIEMRRKKLKRVLKNE